MRNYFTGNGRRRFSQNKRDIIHQLSSAAFTALALVLLMATTGCQTSDTTQFPDSTFARSQPVTLREGDVLKITFPGAPNLNTTQQVRRDGKVTLPLIGEQTAAGKVPADFQTELVKLYGPQLVSKEVTVAVESASFPIFVTGAAVRPGKIISDRPVTAVEAIMEAGGFDYAKANLKGVMIIRQENGQLKNYSLNLKQVMEGKRSEPFYLKPSDIIYIPEKFTWF
jgi:polysaccharide export outer membrane protein